MSLDQALDGADLCIGCSSGGRIDIKHIHKMNVNPIIFVLSNPTPELDPRDVEKARPDCIVGTSLDKYPNQINNMLIFPLPFRYVLDQKLKNISMSLICHALLAGTPIPTQSGTGRVPDR